MDEKKAPELPNRQSAQRAAGEQTGAPATRGREVNDHIKRHLKALYDEVANEPVPDRFMDLLDQLDQKTRGE